MNKYFLKDGTREKGPFLLDDLKYQRIKSDTLIKIDNGKWQPISQVDDLLFLLKANDGTNTYSSATTTKQSNANAQNEPAYIRQQAKKRVATVIAITIAMAVLGMAGALFFASNPTK